MSKQVNRVCDLCGGSCTAKDDQHLMNLGWTELRYTFGSIINAYNAVVISKDICPECAQDMGLVKVFLREDKSVYVERPGKEDIKQDQEDTLEKHFRDFVTNIGTEEGWYTRNE